MSRSGGALAKQPYSGAVAAGSMVELRRRLALDPPLPPRELEERQVRERKHWQADVIAMTLVEAGILGFPIERLLREDPDCQLSAGPRRIGLELTEVVQPGLRDALALQRQEYPDAVVDGGDFGWSEAWSPQRIRDYLANGGDREPTQGGASAGIQDCANAVAACLASKTALLNRPDFERFEENWLGIHVPYPGLSRAHDLERLAALLPNPREVAGDAAFDHVLVLVSRRLIVRPDWGVAATGWITYDQAHYDSHLGWR
jgi:hypothetical protein